MTVDMSHHDLLVHIVVALQKVGITRVVIDDHLVDSVQPIGKALAEPLILHPKSPMRVAVWKSHEAGNFIELLEIQNLEKGFVEIKTVVSRVAFNFPTNTFEIRRQIHQNLQKQPGGLVLLQKTRRCRDHGCFGPPLVGEKSSTPSSDKGGCWTEGGGSALSTKTGLRARHPPTASNHGCLPLLQGAELFHRFLYFPFPRKSLIEP